MKSDCHFVVGENLMRVYFLCRVMQIDQQFLFFPFVAGMVGSIQISERRVVMKRVLFWYFSSCQKGDADC